VPEGQENGSEDLVPQIPPEEDFSHSTRPLPGHLSLKKNLPIEIVDPEQAHIQEIYREQMRQAKLSFNCALPLGVIGALVAIWGAVSWSQSSGKAWFGIGGIMDILSFFLLKFHGEINRRLEETRRDFTAARREERLFLKALQISAPGMKDETIADFVKASLKRKQQL
jgi:hypothetical protein